VPDSVAILATTTEVILLISGLVLFWRLVLRPQARSLRPPSPLTAWEAPVHEFLAFIFMVLFGAMTAAFIGSGLAPRLSLIGDEVTVFNGAMAQVGMLGGVAAYRHGIQRTRVPGPPARVGIFTSGVATFLISLPVLMATGIFWQAALHLLGLPAEEQDLIGMFADVDSPVLLAIMITLAIVTAPISEELVFRAGIFRYFRTRMPRWLALLTPAVLFAVLHVNWDTLEGLASLGPLVMLAVTFSLAYERTGQIGTSMVAHALFNLNTIMLIFSGVEI
jgi:membrane protease YdiL (CAAX protease family)